jgi:ubiquinone/menaquinone biosynthesis C-methylase UbiE
MRDEPMSHKDQRSYFDNPEVWNPEIWQKREADHMRAKLAGEWLPADVRSILDVGCGNGVFANMMEPDRFIVGLDQSMVALVNVTAPRIQGDAAKLPFADNAFDAVLSMEMLEHLPVSNYQTCLSELLRVASRYILITVPYKEKLEYYQVVCPACHCSFHPFHHLRSYQQSDFGNLFGPHTHLERLEAVIPAETEAMPCVWNLIRRYYHRHGMNFPNTTVCPRCGFMVEKNNITIRKTSSTQSVKANLYHMWPKRNTFSWWMACYRKE